MPFAWLLEVWARDLTTIAGRFRLSAATEDERAWDLLTVSPDFDAPERPRLST